MQIAVRLVEDSEEGVRRMFVEEIEQCQSRDACFFPNRSVKQREDILTNKLAAITHVIVRKTQIAQCAAVNNWGDTWNIIRWWSIMNEKLILTNAWGIA